MATNLPKSIAKYRVVCDQCKAKHATDNISHASVEVFVKKHEECNYLSGLRIELSSVKSPLRSKHYAWE